MSLNFLTPHPGFDFEDQSYGGRSRSARAPLSSVIISCPHAGILLPLEAVASLAVSKQELRRRGDRYTDWLFCDAPRYGMPLLVSKIAPAYLNVGRAVTSIHPKDVFGGLDNLPYEIDKYVEGGQGLVAVKTLYGQKPIYKLGQEPDEAEIKRRIIRYYNPYHNMLLNTVKSVALMQTDRKIRRRCRLNFPVKRWVLMRKLLRLKMAMLSCVRSSFQAQ